MKDERTIPEDVQELCRKFAKLAQQHELVDFTCGFQMPYDHEWGGKVGLRWEWGRHGDDSNQIHITSNFTVFTQVNLKV